MAYLPWNDLPPSSNLSELTEAQAAEQAHITSVINWLRAKDDVKFLEQRLEIAKREVQQTEAQYDVTLTHLHTCNGDVAKVMAEATNIREQLRDYELRADGATMLKLRPDSTTLKPVPTHPKHVKPNAKNQLYYSHTVSTVTNERSYHDQRVRVTKTITEYRDERGDVYRKTYETKAPHEAVIFREGTNVEINRNLRQW